MFFHSVLSYLSSIIITLSAFLICFGGEVMAQQQDLLSNVPISAPINTDSAGKAGQVAFHSVFRVICPSTDSAGTGFLHTSGKVTTAEHVVSGCTDAIVLGNTGKPVKVSKIITDADLDLALLSLTGPIGSPALPISQAPDLSIGLQVSTWGFPSGFNGLSPLLSVGYLSGIDARKSKTGKVVEQWVVNAPFYKGNSGGPLLNIETGEVIGVVSSKLAPIPPSIQSALEALSKQKSGFVYHATLPDGTTKQFSEGQVVAEVLHYLRGQVQLVIGYAVKLGDLRTFLKTQGVSP